MKKYHAFIVVFIGSMLLFGIQPMLGGTLLPAFGGSAAVWTVCLAAFQMLLFIGYLYAHLISKKTFKTQRAMHLVLLAIATLWTLGFVFFLPNLRNLVGVGSAVALKVVFSVLFIVGLPYVLLSAGSTLVQVWISSSRSGSLGGVYKLYAVSNLGSFIGLFAYPLIVEPFVSLRMQWLGFSVFLGAYTVLLAGRFTVGTVLVDKGEAIVKKVSAPNLKVMLLWFLLPASSVFLLNALTAHITLDIMPLPLLWAVLLGLFLLSYVVGFSGLHSKWFLPLPFLVAGLTIFSALISKRFDEAGFVGTLYATLALCFFGPLFLHHWLYQLRPKTEHLTLYYLGNAAGGAIGGLCASIVAPQLFKTVAEYSVALGLIGGVLVVYAIVNFPRKRILASSILVAGLASLFAVGMFFIWAPKQNAVRPVVYRDRGFFGTLAVSEMKAKVGEEVGYVREFYHGNTLHGVQADLPSMRRMPTSYFTPKAGGLAILQHQKYKQGQPMRVAIAGLGVGVLYAYSREGDLYRSYEISAEALTLATNSALFTFIADSPADNELIFGDARKALETERSVNEPLYDVIYIDAFTGDNLPRHLSTREAFQLYFDRLAVGGVLAVNISNRFMDLTPLIKSVGVYFECPVLVIHQREDISRLQAESEWAFFMKQPPEDFEIPPGTLVADVRKVRDFVLPTDDRGSFLSLVKWPWRD